MFAIRCPLREAGYTSRDEAGLLCPEGKLSFYEYDQLVSLAAGRLASAGVAPGERVGLVVDHGWRAPVLLLAIIRAGGVACVLDPALAPGESAATLKGLGCGRAVVSAAGSWVRQREGIDVVAAAEVAELGLVGDAGGFPDMQPADNPATIVAGTRNGARAFIVHAYRSHYYSARGSNANVKLGSHDRWLLASPVHAMEGIATIFRCLVGGATLVIPEAGRPIPELLAANGVTHACLSREEMDLCLGSLPGDDDKLRAVMVTGPVSEDMIQRAASRAVRVYSHYSRPEMASQIAAVHEGASPAEQATQGRVLKYRELRVGEGGAIMVRGHTLFLGYAEGREIVPSVDPDGWFATGDIGRLDASGCLTVLGR